MSQQASEHAAHFEDLAQQAHAARLGTWVFLGSETLLFAALIGLFWSYRIQYWESFELAAHHNLPALGAMMTLVLLVSSFLVAWAVHAIRHGHTRACFGSLCGALALGLTFLGMKAYEYGVHFAEGIFPGQHYTFAALPAPGANLFFTLYYFLTGLHALHVVAGLLVLGALAWLTRRGRFGPQRYHVVENGGLYWHLVDIVWLLLWPMLYLA